MHADPYQWPDQSVPALERALDRQERLTALLADWRDRLASNSAIARDPSRPLETRARHEAIARQYGARIADVERTLT